jgi:hypothetical protein
MRMFDSLGTQSSSKLQSTASSVGMTLQQHQQQQQRLNITKLKQSKNYYRGEDTKNPYDYKSYKFNMEQAWNPVNNYIYGPTINSIYNQQSQQDKDTQTHKKLERILNINNINNRDRDSKNMKASENNNGDNERDFFGKIKNRPEKQSSRKMLGEFFDNESPRLCDHAIEEFRVDSVKRRTCSPIESYVSTGRDMVIN